MDDWRPLWELGEDFTGYSDDGEGGEIQRRVIMCGQRSNYPLENIPWVGEAHFGNPDERDSRWIWSSSGDDVINPSGFQNLPFHPNHFSIKSRATQARSRGMPIVYPEVVRSEEAKKRLMERLVLNLYCIMVGVFSVAYIDMLYSKSFTWTDLALIATGGIVSGWLVSEIILRIKSIFKL